MTIMLLAFRRPASTPRRPTRHGSRQESDWGCPAVLRTRDLHPKRRNDRDPVRNRRGRLRLRVLQYDTAAGALALVTYLVATPFLLIYGDLVPFLDRPTILGGTDAVDGRRTEEQTP